MSFGNKLFEIRTKHNLSQEKLAELLNVSALTIHRWEYDKNVPNIHQVKAICEIFNVRSEYFFEESSTQENSVIEEVSSTETTSSSPKGTSECTKKKGVSIFIDKWYLWALYTPWFIILSQAFESSIAILIFGVPCIGILFLLTGMQEFIYRYSKIKLPMVQYILSMIKCGLLGIIAIGYFVISTNIWWKIFFIVTALISILTVFFERIVIKNTYECLNEKKDLKKKGFLTITNIPFWIFIDYWSIVLVYMAQSYSFSAILYIPCLIFLLCIATQEWIFHFGKNSIKEKQFSLCLIKYLIWAVYAVFYIWTESNQIMVLHIGALCVTIIVGVLEWRLIEKLK